VLVRTATVTAQGALKVDPSTRSGDFYLATTGDLDMATSGDFLMATDSLFRSPAAMWPVAGDCATLGPERGGGR